MNKKRELTEEEIEASNKTSIVVICISLLVIVVFCAYFLPNFFPNMGNKNNNIHRALRNTNSKILEGANMGSILVSDVILEMDNGKSSYKANIKNNTDQEYYVEGIKITYFHDDQMLGTIEIMVNKTLRQNESMEIKANSDTDFTIANSANYEFISNN